LHREVLFTQKDIPHREQSHRHQSFVEVLDGNREQQVALKCFEDCKQPEFFLFAAVWVISGILRWLFRQLLVIVLFA